LLTGNGLTASRRFAFWPFIEPLENGHHNESFSTGLFDATSTESAFTGTYVVKDNIQHHFIREKTGM
jgi:hypothetical protein